MMRWMIPLLPRCFLVAFVHRYRLGYVPLSYYIYINIFNLRINFVDFFPIYKYISVDNRWGVSHLEPLKSLLVFVEDIALKHFQEQKRTIYIIPYI